MEEKGRPPSPGLVARSRPGLWTRWGRGVLVVIGGVLVLSLASWTMVLYSLRLSRLQDRVDALEKQCKSHRTMEQMMEERLDLLLHQVGL